MAHWKYTSHYRLLLQPLCERGLTSREIAKNLGINQTSALLMIRRFGFYPTWIKKREALAEAKKNPYLKPNLRRMIPVLLDAKKKGYSIKLVQQYSRCRFEGLAIHLTLAEKLVEGKKYFRVWLHENARDRAHLIMFPNGHYRIELPLLKKKSSTNYYKIKVELSESNYFPSKSDIRKQKRLRKLLTGGGQYGSLKGLYERKNERQDKNPED